MVVRGDCHAVRHAVAHAMIMTVDGELPCVRHTQPGPFSGLCGRCAVACPSRPHHPGRTTSTTSTTPRPGAATTTADPAGDRAQLPSKAIDHGAGPVDQSPTAPFTHSAHHLSDTSRRDNSSATTVDHDRIPRSGLRRPRPARRTDPRVCPGRLVWVIWVSYSAPTSVQRGQIGVCAILVKGQMRVLSYVH